MSSKITSFIVASILTLLLLASAASALISVSSSVAISQSANVSYIVITPSSPVNITLNGGSSTLVLATGLTASLNQTQLSNVSSTANVAVILGSVPSSLAFGKYSITVPVYAVSTSNSTVSENSSVEISYTKGFCKSGSAGENLSLESVDISSSGEDDTDWRPLDEIEVKVRVQNNGDNDAKEIVAEIGLYNDNGKNMVRDVEFSNSGEESIDLGTIKDGDDKTATFTFKVPADFNFDDGSSYRLVVKAYSDKIGESKECIDTSDDLSNSFYEDISIDRQDDEDLFIAFDQTTLSQDEATCGDIVTLNVKAYNVGDSDQDEVTLYLFNKQMSLNQKIEIRNGLEMDEDYDAAFEFAIPSGLKDGWYNLELYADYEDGSTADSPTIVPIKVLGCQIVQPVAPAANETTAPEAPAEEEQTSAWASIKNAFSGNGLIWLVALINIVLIIIIIIVAVRIARR